MSPQPARLRIQLRKKGVIPSGISRLVNLEWLNLSENHLTGPVPAALSSHTRLVELNLSANRLSGPLPTEICDMGRLVSLQVSHNDLEGSLPAEVNKLSQFKVLHPFAFLSVGCRLQNNRPRGQPRAFQDL